MKTRLYTLNLFINNNIKTLKKIIYINIINIINKY